MDITIIFSIIFSFACVILGFTMEGGALGALIQETAFIIVVGATFGATGISTDSKVLKRIPKVIGVAFRKRNNNLVDNIEFFKDIAIKTRRDGLLSLEAEVNNKEIDSFIRKGLQMIVDGVSPELLRGSLETNLEQITERHEQNIAVFEAAGGYAPTMGILGTVMGLVQVLGALDDPDTLGPKIAVAFIATLYGIGTANLLYLPIASKLKGINNQEFIEKEMCIEALLLIQDGAGTNAIISKLEGYLTESEVEKLNESTEK